MKKEDTNTQIARDWHSRLHFTFDQTAMPRIYPFLNVTKNEISTKIFNSRNAERAEKVIGGEPTKMSDMLALAARYDIDLAQFLLLPNGKHPIIITEEEHERLVKSAHSSTENNNEELLPCRTEAPIEVPEVHIDDTNAATLIKNAREASTKIYSLYERIIELTAENARLKTTLRLNEIEECK